MCIYIYKMYKIFIYFLSSPFLNGLQCYRERSTWITWFVVHRGQSRSQPQYTGFVGLFKPLQQSGTN